MTNESFEDAPTHKPVSTDEHPARWCCVEHFLVWLEARKIRKWSYKQLANLLDLKKENALSRRSQPATTTAKVVSEDINPSPPRSFLRIKAE